MAVEIYTIIHLIVSLAGIASGFVVLLIGQIGIAATIRFRDSSVSPI
jgi:hypothetical protein